METVELRGSLDVGGVYSSVRVSNMGTSVFGDFLTHRAYSSLQPCPVGNVALRFLSSLGILRHVVSAFLPPWPRTLARQLEARGRANRRRGTRRDSLPTSGSSPKSPHVSGDSLPRCPARSPPGGESDRGAFSRCPCTDLRIAGGLHQGRPWSSIASAPSVLSAGAGWLLDTTGAEEGAREHETTDAAVMCFGSHARRPRRAPRHLGAQPSALPSLTVRCAALAAIVADLGDGPARFSNAAAEPSSADYPSTPLGPARSVLKASCQGCRAREGEAREQPLSAPPLCPGILGKISQ